MFEHRVTIFKLLGFEVRVDASWVIIAALIVWSLAAGYFPYRIHGLSRGTYWWMGVAGAVGLFVSIIFHEFCHSIVARTYGLKMKGITLFIFGGIAEMEEEPPSAKVEFLMAIAGPLSSVALGFIFKGIALGGRGAWPIAALGVVSYLAWINWILAAFNLIPAFPLDGGRVLRAALWHWQRNLPRATRIAASIGQGFGILLMVAGVFELFSGDVIGAIWWFLIGMFLQSSSKMSYRQVVVSAVLGREPIRLLMNTHPITASPDVSLADLVEDYIYRYHHKMFPVVSNSTEAELLGCVTLNQVKHIPRNDWERLRVGDILQRRSPANTVSIETDAAKVLSLMARTGNSRLMVADGNRLAGVISSKDLIHFLSMKLELTGGDLDRLEVPEPHDKAAA